MFGKYLKAARERADLKINELARLANVDHGYLSKLESDKRPVPSPEFLEKIQPWLKVPLNELRKAAGYIDIPNEPKYAPLKDVCIADEYIKKGLSEEQIRLILDSVLNAVKGKNVE